MEKYNISGMSCAACSSKVEKAVSKVSGVTSCNVNLLTNSMTVEGSALEDDIIKAVTDAGYGASNAKANKDSKENDDELKDRQSPIIAKRLIASLLVLLPLMYVSMGHMMFNWPLPGIFMDNPVAIGIYELILSGLVMVINQKFFVNGFKGLIHKAPNMDTLISLGSMASFLYSIVALFLMADACVKKSPMEAMGYMEHFYFESAAMILTLITVGKLLEARSKGRTTDALRALMDLSPKTAVIKTQDGEIEVSVDKVKVGDIFVVKAGENIPVDGIVEEGNAAVDEAALTGESIPVDKKKGDRVSAATTNKSGYIVCKAIKVGEDTTLSQIIQMVSDAAATKAPIAKIADKVSGIFVPTVMAISFITFIIWILCGAEFGYALTRAVAVLVISCPCALGLATPVAIMVGSGKAARSGIMFKTALSLEKTGNVNIVALDKTGTITQGKPGVTSIICATGVDEEKLIKIAVSLESRSEHPLSRAVVAYAGPKNIPAESIEDFETIIGSGIKGICQGKVVIGGNEEYIKESLGENADELKAINEKLSEYIENGHTPLYFAEGSRLLGAITVADIIKEDSVSAVEELKELGLHVVMLTGDNEKTAAAIGNMVGVDEVVASVKPDGKEAVIKELQKYGKVAMVGDGINDAVALTRADIGIAIGAGTDIAIDAADLVLMKNSLRDVAAAIRLSRHTLINIYENLFWAFIFNIIGIPLAAGLWIPVFGWELKPMFGAAAMSLSSFIVVTNALRINLFNPYNRKKNNKKSPLEGKILLSGYINKKEKEKMEITVNGMMCPHCEAHVKAALEKIDGVVEAKADHTNNCVAITTSKDVAEDAIKAAVVEAGYEYVGIK